MQTLFEVGFYKNTEFYRETGLKPECFYSLRIFNSGGSEAWHIFNSGYNEARNSEYVCNHRNWSAGGTMQKVIVNLKSPKSEIP